MKENYMFITGYLKYPSGKQALRGSVILFLLLGLFVPGFSQSTVTQSNFTSVVTPQFMGSGDATRLPVMFRATVSGLAANTTYRYFVQGATNSTANGGSVDFGTNNPGAGNPLLVNSAGTVYKYTSNPSLSSTANYETFVTNASGSYTGWFGFVNTGNARFSAGNTIYPCISLGTSSSVTMRKALNVGIKVLAFTTTAGANNGSFIKSATSATAKNLVAIYDNTTGTGRPLAVTPVENSGIAAAEDDIIPLYTSTAGSWNTVIPNNNANGVRRIEQLSVTTGNIVGCATDADGIWPTGSVSTVNPLNGKGTAKTIASADDPLTSCVAAIVLSSSNPAMPAANIGQGSVNNVVYRFSLAVTVADASLTGITITTAGTYAAADLANFKCWYSADATFGSGTDVLLSTKTAGLAPGTHSFPSFTAAAIDNGSTGYIFITTDLPCSATPANTLSVGAVTTANLSFASGTKSGTASAGGTQTIIAATPVNVTGASTSGCSNEAATVNWTLPSTCYDNIIVFAKQGAFTGAIPSGNGAAYNADAAFGNGTAFDGGYCVYNGTGTGVNIIALTNGLNYNYKIFTLNETSWSNGISVACTPVFTTNAGDHFRSNVTSGSWSAPSSWQSSSNGISWATATLAPASAANTITILAGHTINVNSTVSLDQAIIHGTVVLQNAGTININNGAGDDISIDSGGVLRTLGARNYSVEVVYAASANIHVLSGGTISVGTGPAVIGSGYHDFTNGNNTWDTDAVYEWNTTSAFIASNITYFTNAITTRPIFRINTPAGIPGGGSATVINGLLEVNADLSFIGAGAKTFRDGITGTGTLTLPSTIGTATVSSPDAILGGTLTLVLNKQLNLTNGITVPAGADVLVTGAAGFAKNGGNFTVDGIIDLTDRTISNTSGNVTINGTLKTAHAAGLYNPGNIAGGTIILNAGSTIAYNANANQSVTSTATLSQSYYNLTLSTGGIKTPLNAIHINTAGTVTISGPVTVNAAANNIGPTGSNTTNFTMDGGRLILGTTGTLPLMDGVYNLTGGVMEYNGTAQTIRSKAYQHIEITGAGVGNSGGNITLNDAGTFTVKSGGIFSINDNSITGPAGMQTVMIENGGSFLTGNNEGFNGFTSSFTNNAAVHANIEAIILENESTVRYTRAGDQPITVPGTAGYGNLELSGTGIKTAPAAELVLRGNLDKTTAAVFNHNNGTVIFNGALQQQYTAVAPFMGFYQLTDNNNAGLAINNDLAIEKELLLGTGAKLALGAGNITLRSNSINTASFAQLPASAQVSYVSTGRFIVERFIQSGRKWRLLAVPTDNTNTQTIREAWQEGATGAAQDPYPGFGMQVTDNRNTWNLNGFDAFSPGGPSVKVFDPVSGNYQNITSTSQPIANKYGYMAFVRGNRLATTVNAIADTTVLRVTGKLNTGTQTAVTIPAGRLGSVGNPYASAIDLRNVVTTNLTSEVYLWDPKLGGIYGLGAYQTLTKVGSDYLVVPGGGSYPATGNYNTVESGQAFFVRATGSDGSVLFGETNKTNGSAEVFFSPGQAEMLRCNLYQGNGSGIILDGVLALFENGASNDADDNDGLKISNGSENVALSRNGRALSVERRAPVTGADTLFLDIKGVTAQEYTWQLNLQNMDAPGRIAILEDRFTSTKTPLDMAGATAYNFTVTSDPASKSASRFYIVFKQSVVLPVRITRITAVRENDLQVAVGWHSETETGIRQYQVERSEDGNNFRVIAHISPAANNGGTADYTYPDNTASAAALYYRVKATGLDGTVYYSDIALVKAVRSIPSISVYPNPVKDGLISLRFQNQPQGLYQLRLINNAGQVVYAAKATVTGSLFTTTVTTGKTLAAGIYQLVVLDAQEKQMTQQVIVE